MELDTVLSELKEPERKCQEEELACPEKEFG
jgi:hypothetical protein